MGQLAGRRHRWLVLALVGLAVALSVSTTSGEDPDAGFFEPVSGDMAVSFGFLSAHDNKGCFGSLEGDPIRPGETFWYCIRVKAGSGEGGNGELGQLMVVDQLPEEVDATGKIRKPRGDTCEFAELDGVETLTCDLGRVVNKRSQTVAFEVIAVGPDVDGDAQIENQAVFWDEAAPQEGRGITLESEITFEPGVLLFSLRKPRLIQGIQSEPEDILRRDGFEVSMYFDGSDVGAGGMDIDGLATLADGSLLLSFRLIGELPGVPGVDDSDIVRFLPTSLGENTAGTWERWLDGSEIGLHEPSEDIDAIEYRDGDLYLSTTGRFSAEGRSGRPEDVYICREFAPEPENSCDSFLGFVDGGDINLDSRAGDIDGFALTAMRKQVFSTMGKFDTGSFQGLSHDVWICLQPTMAPLTSCQEYLRVFDGSDFLLGPNVDAVTYIDY